MSNIRTARGVDHHFAYAMLLQLVDFLASLNQFSMKQKRRLEPRTIQTDDEHPWPHIVNSHAFFRGRIFPVHVVPPDEN